jgi:hypothetical protein
METNLNEPTTNPQIHIQSNEVENPDDAYEMVFHKIGDGTLFVEWYNSKYLTDNGMPIFFQANFSPEQKHRLIEFFKCKIDYGNYSSEPSENIGQLELEEKIEKIFDDYSDVNDSDQKYIMGVAYPHIIQQIAALFPSRSEENEVKKELISLQAFILMNELSDSLEDYNFPKSTPKSTKRMIIKAIASHNEMIKERIRKSIRI